MADRERLKELLQKRSAKRTASFDIASATPVESATFDVASATPATSGLDSPYARGLFRGGGQFLGGLTAGALATPGTLGAATVPAAVAGSIGGGVAGESLRQFLASFDGGGPQSYGEQVQELGRAGAGAALSEAALPAVGAVGKALGGTLSLGARHIYRNIPDPVLDWVKTRYRNGVDILNDQFLRTKESIMPVIEKLGTAIKSTQATPHLVDAPSPKSLYPVAEKAVNALEAVRQQAMDAYGTAATVAQEKPLRVSLTKGFGILVKELQAKGVIDAKGQPIRLGPRGVTGAEGTLLSLYEDMLSLRPTGQPAMEGLPGQATYQTFRRILDRIDEAVGSVGKNRNAQRILLQTRETLEEGLTAADEALAKQIPAYGQFAGLRKTFEQTFKDPDRTVNLLLSSGKDTKSGLTQQLQQLNDLAPQELQFMGDIASYHARVQKAVLAKQAPKTVNRLVQKLSSPDGAERLARSIFTQPETTMRELQALEELSGVPFLDDLKDMAAREAFRSWRPSGMGYPNNAIGGVLGYGTLGAPGAALGLMAGTAASTPAVQATMLRSLLPGAYALQRATEPARTVARGFAPTLPPALSFLLTKQQN